MKKIFTSLALAAALVAAAPVAQALPISGTLTLNAFNNTPVTSATMYADGTFTSAGVGGLQATWIEDDFFFGGPGFFEEDFLVYCIELFSPAANFGVLADYTKNVDPIYSGAIPAGTEFSATQLTRFDNLFDKAATLGLIGLNGAAFTGVDSAAMQLAIWEIVHETSTFGNVGSGSFYTNANSTVKNQANFLLADLDIYAGDYAFSFTSFNNGSDTKAGKQDFIAVAGSFGDSCAIGNTEACEVPEPGTLALAGLGLFGLAALRRRKSA